jgi:hypothetical protein
MFFGPRTRWLVVYASFGRGKAGKGTKTRHSYSDLLT